LQYWLLKSEPDCFSYEDLLAKGREHWDGVRNYQARNNLSAMHIGDLCLFYHSVSEKAVVGIAEVASTAYPDPTTDDDRWVVVDVVPKKKLKRPVTLAEIKENPALQDMKLIRQSRLSVTPLTEDEFNEVLKMGK
jgi:predicted RNA-binding protein with PUA-like domain